MNSGMHMCRVAKEEWTENEATGRTVHSNGFICTDQQVCMFSVKFESSHRMRDIKAPACRQQSNGDLPVHRITRVRDT